MKTYPIMLDITGRRCVVVGGGKVGLRKVASLLRAAAAVRLVEPAAPAGAVPDGVELVAEPYEKRHLAGAMLVYAGTADEALNARIAADARAAGAIVNAVDQPADCDFYVPAVVADGDVIVAVGTGGASPALAAALKRTLAAVLPERIGEFAAALAKARKHVLASVDDPDRRARILKALAAEAGYETFIDAGADALIDLADRIE